MDDYVTVNMTQQSWIAHAPSSSLRCKSFFGCTIYTFRRSPTSKITLSDSESASFYVCLTFLRMFVWLSDHFTSLVFETAEQTN